MWFSLGENHISGAGESCEAGNPGTLGMTKGRAMVSWKKGYWRAGFFITLGDN
jgi:hypothetical protein